MKLIIEDDEGRKTVVPVVREEITIGRDDGNVVKLTERNVSRRHARLKRQNGQLLIEDLGSYNGVRINGERIAEPTPIKEGDLIEIGDYDLGVEGRLEAPPPHETPAPRATTPPAARTIPPGGASGKTIPPGPPAVHRTVPPTPPTVPPSVPPPGQSMASPSAGGATAIIRISDVMKNAPQVEARDLQKTEMPRLVGLSGAVRGKEFFLMRTEVKLGRSDDNDIAIDHQSISRQHARFVLEDAVWKVIDSRSANGVFINGEQYAIGAVKPGDTLELGHLRFRFCAPGEKFTLSPDRTDEPRAAPSSPVAAPIEAPRLAPTRKRKLPLAIAAAGGALALAIIVAALLLTKARRTDQLTEGELSAGDSIKAGDRELKKHDFLKALEFYDAAVVKGETAPNRAKAQDEARAQEINRDLERAIANGDFDKGRALYEKCASETTWFCQRAQEKLDQVKAGYAKTHLARAQTAKAAGKAELCNQEVQQVLAFDATNAQAQGTQCVIVQQAQAEKPAPARREREPAASQAQRDQKAYQLIQEGNAKVTSRDFETAAAKYQAALDLRPSKQYVGYAYRGLGTAAVYAGDTKAAVKWYKLYMPYADDATKTQLQQLIDKFGG